MTRIIYLDFDGVLVTPAQSRSAPDRDFLCPVKTAMVHRITGATGAKIVVSSTWRISSTCKDALAAAGIPDSSLFHDWATPGDDNAPSGWSIRGYQIHSHAARWDIRNYVILDDFPVCRHQRSRHVQTDLDTGLTQALADRATTILLAA